MTGLEPVAVAGLVLLAVAAGVGITAVGPGGVLVTAGLFALAPLSPAQVAGTALVTNVATGVLGTAVYTRSGQLREPVTRRAAVLLCGGAVAGTPVGVLLNGLVTGRVFGVLLGALHSNVYCPAGRFTMKSTLVPGPMFSRSARILPSGLSTSNSL
ncbi:TSUP family transporter, partial [Actinomadura sp. DSM 109109]|nr:TSUP family transporter [Actinomadura lepetitiana]